MMIDRCWAMPSKHTFSIPPIRALIEQYKPHGLIINPFANSSKLRRLPMTSILPVTPTIIWTPRISC